MADLAANNPLRKSLRPSALSGAMTPASHCNIREWQSSYLVTTDLDDAMPKAFQMWLVERAREAGAAAEVTKVRSGHFMQVSEVEEIGDWLVAMVH